MFLGAWKGKRKNGAYGVPRPQNQLTCLKKKGKRKEHRDWPQIGPKMLRNRGTTPKGQVVQRPNNPPKIPRHTQKNGAFTRTFSKSSRELLPSPLWHESGTQRKLSRKTCSDELFYFGWIISGGISSSDGSILEDPNLLKLRSPGCSSPFFLSDKSIWRQ